MPDRWRAACAAAVVAAAAALGAADARAGGPRREVPADRDLVVTLVTPTLGQEVLPDLSDPGLNHVVTVRFSAPLRARDFVSHDDAVARLAPGVEFVGTTLERLPATPSVQGNVLRLDPRAPANGGVLADGQYTLTVRASVRSARGRLLNRGTRDFATSFTVGADVHAPILRRTSPAHRQRGVGLAQRVVLTFSEPLLPASLPTAVSVSDVGTSPPTPILGAHGSPGVSAERDGFDLVFTPDPCFGYPPRATVEVRVQGRPRPDAGSPSVACRNPPPVPAVTDVFGNAFTRDAGLWWSRDAGDGVWDSPNGTFEDCTGAFKLRFETRGVTPPPAGLVPGSSVWRTANPRCAAFQTVWANSCDFQGRVVLYTTGTGLGEIDLTSVLTLFNGHGVLDLARAQVVRDSPVRLGRPAGVAVDPRWDPLHGNHTYLYVVDLRAAAVLVLDSRNLKVLGRITGFTSPRDVGIATDYAMPPTRVQMFVSDFGARQVVALDLSSIAVALGGRPGAKSPCEAIADDLRHRVVLPVGAGPVDVSCDSYLLRRAIVVNSLGGSVSVLDAARMTVLGEHAVGGNPVSADWILWGFGTIDVAAVANQGGLHDPDGSVSLYLRSPPLNNVRAAGLATPRDGIESTFTDGCRNPTYLWGNQEWASPATGTSAPPSFFVPNTGGRTVQELTLRVSGVFGVVVDFQAVQTRDVGVNPTGAMLDPYYPNQFLVAAVAGEGRFVGADWVRALAVDGIPVPGIRRIFTCYSH